MSQSAAHSRQPSKNQRQIQAIRKDSYRGDYDVNEICQSPQNKYNSLIKRFNKKPENVENPHLKYLQNGIKDVNLRNINFQLKNSESSTSLIQDQERLNAHKRLTDPFSQLEMIDPPRSTNLKDSDKQGSINNLNQNSISNKTIVKQGSVKPIRTICLNLFEQKDEADVDVKRQTKNSINKQSNQLSNNHDNFQQNKSNLNGFTQQINIGKVQTAVAATSSSTLSNSTRFSPRYSQHGLNLYTQNSQQSIKTFNKESQENQQMSGIIFGNPESSESDLNQNDSTITTPTKYQQFSHYPQQQFEVQYSLQTNNSQSSKIKSKNSINSSTYSSSSKNNHQKPKSSQLYIQESKPNQISLRDQQSINYNDSPNHLHNTNSSKINLSYFLKNTGNKNHFTPAAFSLMSSNVHSRKSSSQIVNNDLSKVAGEDQTFQDLILGDNINPKIYQHRNQRGNSISKTKPSNIQLNGQSHQQSVQSNLNTSNRSLLSYNPLTNKGAKDSIKSQAQNTPLQSKKSSNHFQQEDISSLNLRNNPMVSQNLNSSKHLLPTNSQSNKLSQLKSNPSLIDQQLALIQSINMASLQVNPAQSHQNQQTVQKFQERDRSQTYTMDDHFRQRSFSKGNIKNTINNNSSLQQQQSKSNFQKIQKNTLNQSSSQINLSTINASSVQSFIPSQNSAFNFQPSFFTPIDNESIQGYIQRQTSRNNSLAREKSNQETNFLTKQRSCTQQELQTISSFIQLEQQIETNNQQQKEQNKKLKLFS